MQNKHRMELVKLALLVEAAEWDSAAVIILNEEGKALILKRGHTAPWMPNVWNLPGGGRDGNEPSKACAIREAQEEVSITPQKMKLIGAVSGSDYVLDLYLARGYTGTLRLDTSENSEYAWVSVEELDDYRFIPGLKEAIRMAMTYSV